MKKILWPLMLGLIICMGYFNSQLVEGGAGIVTFEFADKLEGKEILKRWADTPLKDGGNLINIARSHTYWDFAFILVYTGLLMVYSYDGSRSTHGSLSHLLRLNVFVAFMAGGMDALENIQMLQSFEQPYVFQETYWITVFKFSLISWVMIWWLVGRKWGV
ncbi:MAG: hypothetical protein EOO89_06340 [Pedobacter sp.]|nr:MAG: hypothetical protein EOO89_06340 [Pedobacter sp.]